MNIKKLGTAALIASSFAIASPISAQDSNNEPFFVNFGNGTCGVFVDGPNGFVQIDEFPCPREFRGDL